MHISIFRVGFLSSFGWVIINSILLISQLLNCWFSKLRPVCQIHICISSFKNVVSASVFLQFGKKDWSWNFVKIEKTEYLSNQLTYLHFDWKFISPHKNWYYEHFFIFGISKMSQISGSPTVKIHNMHHYRSSTYCTYYISLPFKCY